MHPVCGSNGKTTRSVFFVWPKNLYNGKNNEHVEALGASTAQQQAMASHSPTHPRFAKARAPKKIGHTALRPLKEAGDRPDSPINADGEHNNKVIYIHGQSREDDDKKKSGMEFWDGFFKIKHMVFRFDRGPKLYHFIREIPTGLRRHPPRKGPVEEPSCRFSDNVNPQKNRLCGSLGK